MAHSPPPRDDSVGSVPFTFCTGMPRPSDAREPRRGHGLSWNLTGSTPYQSTEKQWTAEARRSERDSGRC